MGYTTDFGGQFDLDRPLTEAHHKYLRAFAGTRRVKHDAQKTAELKDDVRHAADLPIGAEGAYFVGGNQGQRGVIDNNRPPNGQPDVWCQWIPTEDGNGIEWDGQEKFYEYDKWLEYIIEHFLAPWGYKLNGSVTWQGEDSDDRGTIHVKDNVVQIIKDQIVTPEPKWE